MEEIFSDILIDLLRYPGALIRWLILKLLFKKPDLKALIKEKSFIDYVIGFALLILILISII